METFAELLNGIIAEKQISQKELATACGISESAVSNYVSGNRSPYLKQACRMLDSLGYELVLVEKSKKTNKRNTKDKKTPLHKNKSGYYDPTAYRAIRKADAENDRERLTKLLNLIFSISELSDFHVEERIVLKDLRTGKIWR